MFASHQSNFDWGTSNFASNPEKSDSTLHQLARSGDMAPEGMQFAGWALTADGGAELDGDTISSSLYFNHGSDKTEVTIYAKWAEV